MVTRVLRSEVMVEKPKPPIRAPGHTYEVEWTTISYRTIALAIGGGFALVCLVLYLIFPHYFGQKFDQALAVIGSGPGAQGLLSSKRDAHFVNVDGNVRVKKAQSQEWIRASLNTNLAKGDFVQTGSDGVARIIFTDGTNYVLKPDSLIAVQESNEDPVTKADP